MGRRTFEIKKGIGKNDQLVFVFAYLIKLKIHCDCYIFC